MRKLIFLLALPALGLISPTVQAQTFSSRTLHFESTTTVDPGVTADAGVLPYAAGTCNGGVGSAASFRSLTGYTAGGTCGGGAVAAFDPRFTGYAAGGCGSLGANFDPRLLPYDPALSFRLRARASYDPALNFRAGFGYRAGFGGVGLDALALAEAARLERLRFHELRLENLHFRGRGAHVGGVGHGRIDPRFHGAGHAVGHVHARGRLRF